MTNLTKNEALFLTIARVAVGWLMFYAGITKIMDPAWTAKGYLTTAKTFPELFQWFASDANIGWVNFVNEWGLTLLGISLILGIGVRLSSVLGVGLMLLYYFPVLEFPKVEHGFLVDEHIVYAAVLLFFAAVRAGRYWGLENWCANLPICRQYPKLHKFWG
ncbi:MAG: DoxX family protein [Candidatus Colwellbacteria bacterium]|nr:DoxX family protein [Candidatus Colwellbacteria bacterium]